MTTNYERIKAMSVEEMAYFLEIDIVRIALSCNNGVKQWLESEAENANWQ